MITVTAENTSFFYDNTIETIFKYNKYGINPLENEITKNELFSICPPILTVYNPINNPTKLTLEFLFWFEKTDLNNLDLKVQQGIYTDEDFKYSIKAFYTDNLICFNCNKTYKGILSVDGGLYYPGNTPLAKEKKINLIKMGKTKKCSNCNQNFTMIVTHIFK